MSGTEKMRDYFGPMQQRGAGACWTRELNGRRWYVLRVTSRRWDLQFRKDEMWHQFGSFDTRAAAIAAYDAMEV